MWSSEFRVGRLEPLANMSFIETQQWVVPVAAPDDPVLQTCIRCEPQGVVVWNETALCSECFLAASIQMATGRSDLYLTIRTLPPRAGDHVIRAIVRQITARMRSRAPTTIAM